MPAETEPPQKPLRPSPREEALSHAGPAVRKNAGCRAGMCTLMKPRGVPVRRSALGRDFRPKRIRGSAETRGLCPLRKRRGRVPPAPRNGASALQPGTVPYEARLHTGAGDPTTGWNGRHPSGIRRSFTCGRVRRENRRTDNGIILPSPRIRIAGRRRNIAGNPHGKPATAQRKWPIQPVPDYVKLFLFLRSVRHTFYGGGRIDGAFPRPPGGRAANRPNAALFGRAFFSTPAGGPACGT
jgi:hypothetical protein